MTKTETTVTVDAKVQFSLLADQWRRETQNLSSTSEKLRHRAYREIIEKLGPQTIPWILERIDDGPRHWFFALSELSGENPVKPADETSLPAMIRAWKKWGKSRAKAQ